MSKYKAEKLFGGKGAEEYQAIYDALHYCSEDWNQDVYDWLESTPRTSLTCELVDMLHRKGFKIVKA